MGTRGLYGFKYKGKYYIYYSHCDSYFSGLGKQLWKELREMLNDGELEEWLELIEAIKVVEEDDIPTEEDIENCEDFTDLTVSTRSAYDWYCLLYKTQGKLKDTINAGYVVVKNKNDVDDIGKCCSGYDVSYVYLIDFDNEKFEASYYDEDINIPFSFIKRSPEAFAYPE